MSSQKSKPRLFLKSFFPANLTCGCGIKRNKIPDVHQPKPIIPNKSPIHPPDQIPSLTSNCENLVKIDDQRQEKEVEEEKASSTTLSLSIDNSNLVATNTTTSTTPTTTTTPTNNSSPEPEIEPDTQPHTTPAESSSSTSSSITNRRQLSFRSPSKIGQTLAIVKESNDPYFDFKQSMLQMIYEKEIFSSDDLKELLDCFLKLNSSCHHAIIVKAFNEIWNDVLGAIESSGTKVRSVG